MEKVLNFQISLFGSFANIQPDLPLAETIATSLRDDDFLPSIAVVNAVDPIKKQIITENKLQMEAKDHSWHVIFFSERINIDYTYPGGEAYFSDVKSVIERGKEICSHTFASIAETTGVRIAVNGRFLVKDLTDEEKQAFIRKFIVIPTIYGNRPITEWNVHFNAPQEICFGDKRELCNDIVEVYDIIGIDPKNKTINPRLAIGLDINTNLANQELKYTYEDMLYFADAVGLLMDATLFEIEDDQR